MSLSDESVKVVDSGPSLNSTVDEKSRERPQEDDTLSSILLMLKSNTNDENTNDDDDDVAAADLEVSISKLHYLSVYLYYPTFCDTTVNNLLSYLSTPQNTKNRHWRMSSEKIPILRDSPWRALTSHR